MATVWIVEANYGRGWHPPVGCSISNKEGQLRLRRLREFNPYDVFRIAKYVRADSRGERWLLTRAPRKR